MSIRICVCIKQVPSTTEVEIDHETGAMRRDGVEAKLNPFDLFALECALALKESAPSEEINITALTMGPPQAETILREAFMMGVDDVALLSDRRVGGSDVLATSYALAQAIRALGGFDMIICGKQTTDGDTAQVGAELAETLDIPHVTNVLSAEIAVRSEPPAVIVRSDQPLNIETLRIPLPALIAVDKDICEPRLPSYRKKLATRARPIRRLTLDNLPDKDPAHYGFNGSPTRVVRVFPPPSGSAAEHWTGEAAELAEKLAAHLRESKFLQKL